MAQKVKNRGPRMDLDAEALAALEQARAMEPGPERTDAMKRAGILRNAADLLGLFSTKDEKTDEELRHRTSYR
jgi:acyl-CoA reductase-like NAD-dependent aldehyde dehydrogenase